LFNRPDQRAAVITVRVTAELVIPGVDAVMLVVPEATPVAKPIEEIVALLISELLRVTWEVMSELEPFEYVPVAVNCWVEPTSRFPEVASFIAIEESVGVYVDTAVEEHPPITMVNTTTEIRTSQ
jgi:hypothetical protein